MSHSFPYAAAHAVRQPAPQRGPFAPGAARKECTASGGALKSAESQRSVTGQPGAAPASGAAGGLSSPRRPPTSCCQRGRARGARGAAAGRPRRRQRAPAGRRPACGATAAPPVAHPPPRPALAASGAAPGHRRSTARCAQTAAGNSRCRTARRHTKRVQLERVQLNRVPGTGRWSCLLAHYFGCADRTCARRLHCRIARKR